MSVRFGCLSVSSFIVLAGALATGCGSSGSSAGDAGADGTVDGQGGGGSMTGVNRKDAQALSSGVPDSGFGEDAFFANDPEPHYCIFLDGGSAPDAPGGTPTCPSDKNREGCPCPMVGETAACWPGLRVNRDLGQCKDGTTTCVTADEGTEQVWGPCNGYVLPSPNPQNAAQACECFSSGQWAIANLSPCFIGYPGTSGTAYYAVSSYSVDGGIACPEGPDTPPPTPEPGVPWSTDTITADCAGDFKLCYTIKAGSSKSPQSSDCVVSQTCVNGAYTTPGIAQTFPPLPGWTGGNDSTCATQFYNSGGYGEMTVQGQSEYCQGIGAKDGGAPLPFLYIPYCPSLCQTNPNATGCAGCQSGGSGTFGG